MEKEKQSCVTWGQIFNKFKDIYATINKERSEKCITGILISAILVIICVYLKYKTNDNSFIICAILSVVAAIIFAYIYRPRDFKEPESCKTCMEDGKSTCVNDPKYEGIYRGISVAKNMQNTDYRNWLYMSLGMTFFFAIGIFFLVNKR